ncbi:lasso peptide biosynthesis PqqD family chaperone [Cellulosilyticum ruminicola]|uniref:lasso peptide biosynthesis PqqD family chaperone n=1 Tax=Cellulosilyticum ruminicola TaxID=425254 RepID=UPI0006CF698D|nr:lasso peptide biosynthesis PqqD family chaperone [Cellulosilyticum ruminicola]
MKKEKKLFGKEQLTLQSIVIQKKEMYLTDLDEDKVMMDLDSGNYYALNSVGASIWEAIEEAISIEAVVQKLMDEYEVEQDVCTSQVINYLQLLYNSDLIMSMN